MNAATLSRAAPWIVLLAGVSAALHVGKLPPALPVLQAQFGLSLVQSGFLLSLVQLGSMLLGLVAGLLAESMGLRRSVLIGLAMLSLAGLGSGLATDAAQLLALRALEGIGFMLVTVPAPSLIRRSVTTAQLTRMLGLWGAFMPLGTSFGLLAGPLVLGLGGWRGWVWLTALLSALVGLGVARSVPADAPARARAPVGSWQQRLRQTLAARGPWLGALTFGVYSAQWLSVIGFLPSVYAQAGWGGARTALLTALVAAVNIVGNVAAGRLLHRGVAPRALLWTGFGAMALGTLLAFSALTEASPVLRYAGALLFSTLGGLIPGTLFGLAPRLAPNDATIATTVGWMQQWSAVGQVSGPPVVAWVASQAGGWQLTWLVTGACCLAGIGLAASLAHHAHERPRV